jgi:DNA-directed RNA polymerase specialized sigma24 family protein
MAFRAEWDQLLVDARGGDPQALGRLIEATHDDLHAAAAGVLGRAAKARLPADDLFADTLLSVLKELGSLRATNYIGFRFWFASIARNQVCRLLRREHARPGLATEPEVEGDGSTPRPRPAENDAFVRCAVLRLPRSQQVAYVLREGLLLSWHTIGFVLERRAPPAARLLHYRAQAHVKEVAGTRADLRPELAALRIEA